MIRMQGVVKTYLGGGPIVVIFGSAALLYFGLIGEGTHERFIVQNEKFQTKANNKLAK